MNEFKNVVVRSRAPLRLGLAGGGTDLPSYASKYGGAVLNVTINMYAHCTIQYQKDKIIFEALDLEEKEEYAVINSIPTEKKLLLHAGVYNRIVKDYNDNKSLAIKVSTFADAPIGSGLGTSSAIVVAMIKAYVELLKLPLGEYDIAKLAYEIERNDLKLAGGMQDQYAAVFGGFNLMEIDNQLNVIVNPLKLRNWFVNEIEESLVLFFTGKSRESARIIEHQIAQTNKKDGVSLEALQDIKTSAYKMKEHLLKCDIKLVAAELNKGWEAKKKTSSVISNGVIDEIYNAAINAGALAGKVSGAGGGGFMMFIVDPLKKNAVIKELKKYDGIISSADVTDSGMKGWYL